MQRALILPACSTSLCHAWSFTRARNSSPGLLAAPPRFLLFESPEAGWPLYQGTPEGRSGSLEGHCGDGFPFTGNLDVLLGHVQANDELAKLVQLLLGYPHAQHQLKALWAAHHLRIRQLPPAGARRFGRHSQRRIRWWPLRLWLW